MNHEQLNELALFAGAGGGILGGKLLGWRTVCAVEIEPYCRERLMQRQDEGHLPAFPIWDDVRTFDGNPWAGCVDVVTGGFPCQDISAAGKGAGITGEQSGLWKEMARIIGEVRPIYALVENSTNLIHRGLGTVAGDLAELGYDIIWGCFQCDWLGIPQERRRFYGLAYPMQRDRTMGRDISVGWRQSKQAPKHLARPSKGEPCMVGMADGLADRMGRLRATGNGQVPAVVRLAWETLKP